MNFFQLIPFDHNKNKYSQFRLDWNNRHELLDLFSNQFRFRRRPFEGENMRIKIKRLRDGMVTHLKSHKMIFRSHLDDLIQFNVKWHAEIDFFS